MKTVGILGGIGPLAGLFLFQRIIANTQALIDQEHVPVLLYSNTAILDRTSAILSDDRTVERQLITSARLLEDMGADILIVACNTAHYYIDAIQAAIGIPVLNIIQLAIDQAKTYGCDRVMVMGTTATRSTGIYSKVIQQAGLREILFNRDDQEQIMKIIYQDIKAGKPDDVVAELMTILDRAAQSRPQAIIVGCTELSIFSSQLSLEKINIIDPIELVARKAIELAGGQLTEICSIL